ncbi:MAG TPA: LuxR C-terminal-related transcriptional regulator, partial [Streptosporangiaceae bacterium]|nr:LuxR C-terminal-related transcriptional regulator [Streptosporangiaceae bacterium]
DLVADMARLGISVPDLGALRLASEFGAASVPFVLMIDDLHELRSPACHEVLSTVVSAIPHGSQLVAASRAEQPHLPRLRVSADALEFGAADLALAADGARQIFSHEQVSLTPELAVAVTERTEGWPAALSLAALIAKEDNGQAEAIAGDDRYMADYLDSEVLSKQPKAIQRFLRRTAVLDELSAPLCDAVLRSSAGATRLRQAEASGLFLFPLDRRRQGYRYHPLFREFLLCELRRTEPDMVTTLHQRAADWHESNDSPAMALEHPVHPADAERTVRLVTNGTAPTHMAGQLPALQRWHHAIGDVNNARYPSLAVHRCWESVLTGDTAGALRWAAALDAASSGDAPADGTACLGSSRAMLRATMCAAGPEAMMADATFAVAQQPAGSSCRDAALWLLAEAHLLAGGLDEARAVLAEASAVAASSGNSSIIVSCESHLACLAMDRGQWQEAADKLELALATIEDKRLHDDVFSIQAFAGSARLSLYQGDLSQAHRQLTRAMRARSSATYVLPHVAVRLRLQLAKVYLAIADRSTARQLLREIADILARRPALGTLVDQVKNFRDALESSAASGAAGAPPLTPAELRLLPYLQTHLTAPGIAERLFLSTHTVKTEVKAIYRKLGVSSRNDAVRQATAIGLLGA